MTLASVVSEISLEAQNLKWVMPILKVISFVIHMLGLDIAYLSYLLQNYLYFVVAEEHICLEKL